MKTNISLFFHSKWFFRVVCLFCALLPFLFILLCAIPKNHNKIIASAVAGVPGSRVIEFPISVSFSASAYFSRFFVSVTLNGYFEDLSLTDSGLSPLSVFYYTPASGASYWCLGRKSGDTYTLTSVREVSSLYYCCATKVAFTVSGPLYVDLQVYDSDSFAHSYGLFLTKSVFNSSVTLSSPFTYDVSRPGYVYSFYNVGTYQSLDSSTFDSLLSDYPHGTTIYLNVSPLVLAYDSGGYVLGSSGSPGSYDDGYKAGYTDGLNKGQSGQFTSPFDMVFKPVQEFLSIEFFGVSLGTFFAVLVFVMLGLIFLKMFSGG